MEGLDLVALRALATPLPNVGELLERIDAHLTAHDGYLAFSTGKDSLVCLHLALQVDPDLPVVFFDSGLEFPETITYLRDLETAWDLNLTVIPARPSLLEVLASSGFWDLRAGGPARDVDLGEVLIAGPAREAHELFGEGEIWGVRAAESAARRLAYLRARTASAVKGQGWGGRIDRVDGTSVLGPIWDWTTTQAWAYTHRHALPINPVYARLRALGVQGADLRVSHILDAHALDRGMGALLARGWPDLFNDLATSLPRLRS